MCDLGADIRTVWSGCFGGSFRIYALAGTTIYEIEEGVPRAVVNVTQSTEADFFYYRGSLYFVDGTGIFRVGENSLEVPFGYVPLVANNWSDGELGEIYEPHNLLCNKGRLEYFISEKNTGILYLDEFISSIDAVFLNGKLLSPTKYAMGAYSPYITINGTYAGDRVSVYVTYRDTSTELAGLLGNTRAEVFGGINTSRPFLFGGADKTVVYAAGYASESSVAAARQVYPQSDALYFPVGCAFTAGDGRYPVHALCRHYDRLLIFTEGGVWQADSAACTTEALPVMNTNSAVGVISERGAALLGNSPCAVARDGIYRFAADTDQMNDCNAYSISVPIDSMLTPEFLRAAAVFADRRRGELLFSCPDASERIFVYSERTKSWTTFEGFTADSFFDLDGEVGFVRGGRIYAVDDTLQSDSGVTFVTRFEGNICDMESPRTKHLCAIEAAFDGGELDCTLTLDGTHTQSTVLLSSGTTHTRATRRLSSKRFHDLRLKLTAGKAVRAIHSLCVNTR